MTILVFQDRERAGQALSAFLQLLCAGQLGAVFSIEASRLARNGRDWHTLLEFSSVVGALLIDAEAVYDPRLTNDRLLLGMKGTISEMEVANFRARGQAALQQKAARGALVQRVAIGYVKGLDDRIEKSPDARIRSAIELIFSKFAELGSVRQVYFWLDRQQIQLPVAMGSKSAHAVIWRPARYHAVLSVLKNPVYAGAYAYGRSKTVLRLVDGQKQVHRIKRHREEWTVLLQDHHEGYIEWDVYQSNQAMIVHNENARSNAVRGSVAAVRLCLRPASLRPLRREAAGAISRARRDSLPMFRLYVEPRSGYLRSVRRIAC